MIDDLLNRARRLLRRAFILPLWLTPLIAGPSFFFFGWALTHPVPEPLPFLAYHLSAYALAISVTWAMRVARRVRRHIRWLRDFRHTPLGAILSDKSLRAWASVYLTMLWNLVYALAKLLVGLVLRSLWLSSMGLYYLVLAWLRFTIVRPTRKSMGAEREWERYRACGTVLLVMNLALLSVVKQAVLGRGSFHYPGMLIYLMAVYAFWALISATVKLVKARRRDAPRMSAARAVSLTAAMVSMLSLEIALIDRVGDGDTRFRSLRIAVSGGTVCVVELGMALYMIRKGNRRLAKCRQKG